MVTMTRWVIEDEQRPWTANAERQWHHMKRASVVKDARERWAWLAMAAGIPRVEKICVVATPLRKNRASMPDVGACYPAVKAAIDGLVDAGVVDDDDPRHVVAVTFAAPQVVGHDGLRLEIIEQAE
jgi:crossover junction endodeoxyribonuclease RusA